jgi:glycosyltransferase involved in cell wall biosynthesis
MLTRLSEELHAPASPSVSDGTEATQSKLDGLNGSVLFISHYCGRNGAPLILLRLLKWIKANTGINIQIALRSPGELAEEFQAVGSTFYVPRLPRYLSAVVRRLLGQAKLNAVEDALFRRKVRGLEPALIYSNTITNTRELKSLAALDIPVICHVHEMEYWMRHEHGIEQVLATIPLIKHFVAVGCAVREFLVSGLHVNPGLIEIVSEFPSTPFHSMDEKQGLREVARRELRVSDETFVVGACGTVDWRKGADLFLSVARALPQKKHLRLIWVGGPLSGKYFDQLQYDIVRSGLSDLVSFLGPSSSPQKYYAAMDAFLLPSREDPCPLVMLEAASFGLPIVCFKGSGGGPEFVGDDAGIAVPYLDINEMANALIKLQGSPELRHRLGEVGARRVNLRHDADTQCAALFAAMLQTEPKLSNIGQG